MLNIISSLLILILISNCHRVISYDKCFQSKEIFPFDDEEYIIYNILLRRLNIKKIAIIEKTRNVDLRNFRRIKRRSQNYLIERMQVFKDFCFKNQRNYQLSKKFLKGFLIKEKRKHLFSDTVAFSRVAFDIQKEEALVFQSLNLGNIDGGESVIILSKIKKKWKIIEQIYLLIR